MSLRYACYRLVSALALFWLPVSAGAQNSGRVVLQENFADGIQNWTGKNASYEDREGLHDKGSLKLRSNDSAGGRASFKPVNITPGKYYYVQFYCKTSDVEDPLIPYPGWAGMSLSMDGKPFQTEGLSQAGTQGWTGHEFMFIGSPARTIPEVSLVGRGTAWFDNIRIVEFDQYPGPRLVDSSNTASLSIPGFRGKVLYNYPTEKIFPDEEFKGAHPQKAAVEIYAAKNEREAFQLAFRPNENIRSADISFKDAVGPATLKKDVFRWELVDCINIPAQSITQPFGKAGPNPDPLRAVKALDLPAGRTTALWVTVRVPGDVPAGDYAGAMTLAASGQRYSIPLRIHVWNFRLPEKRYFNVSHGSFRLYTAGAGRQAGGPSRGWDQRQYDAFLDNLRERGLEWGAYVFLKIQNLNPEWLKINNGEIVIDFDTLDKVATEYFARGFSGPVNLPPHLRGGRGPQVTYGKWLGLEPATPEFKKYFTEYLQRMAAHLKQKGWLDRFHMHLWDEPGRHEYDAVIKILRVAKTAAPEIRQIVGGPGHPNPAFDGLFDAYFVNLRRPLTDLYMQRLAERHAAGCETGGYGNERYRTDLAAAARRTLAWVMKRYNLTATLWFAVNSFGPDVWGSGMPMSAPGLGQSPGAGFWLYPDKEDPSKMLNSTRWEILTEGYDDYDYLCLLEKAYDDVSRQLAWDHKASAIVTNIVLHVVNGPDLYKCTNELSDVFRVRQAVAREIEIAGRKPLALLDVERRANGGEFLVTGKAEEGSEVFINGTRVRVANGAFSSVLTRVNENAPVRVRVVKGKDTKEFQRYVPRKFPILTLKTGI